MVYWRVDCRGRLDGRKGPELEVAARVTCWKAHGWNEASRFRSGKVGLVKEYLETAHIKSPRRYQNGLLIAQGIFPNNC